MAAGLGFKTFATGDILTAADANGYLMQNIWVFANAAARDAAVTSPQEGNACYLKDTDAVQTYSGSAWVAVGGGGLSSPLTTKGDVWGYSTTNARVPVGTDGQVLTADSAEVTGMKWATAASGGMTSIASGSLSGSALSLTSISGSYKNLQLVLRNATPSVPTDWRLKVNNLGTSVYDQVGYNGANTTFTNIASTSLTRFSATYNNPIDAAGTSMVVNFYDYAKTTSYKQVNIFHSYGKNSGGQDNFWLTGNVRESNAITRIDVTLDSGTFNAGTYILYGVN